MNTFSAMRLSEFIRLRMESILQAWENFARTIEPAALTMDVKALRNHASHMLNAIANDLDQEQTLKEEIAKSEGRGKILVCETAAETHAVARLLSGYSVEQLASEYRALRSSVLRLWAAESKEGLITYPEDITRFNEAIDQSLAESLARYSNLLSQSRNLFLAILGHDLRNPLGATINGAEMLMRSENLEKRCRDIAIRIHNSGRRMSKLVDDLIDYTRTHLGAGLPVTPKPMNMAATAQSAIEEICIAHEGLKIQFSATGNSDGVWDEDRITQVISNLVGNAVQHGTQGAPVAVAIHAEKEQVEVAINNKGPCIPEERWETIFEPLVRLIDEDTTQTEYQKSLGLGLYIAREIVKSHRGTLAVTSCPNEGTTFTILLPRDSA